MQGRLEADVDPVRSPWAFRGFVWLLLTILGAMVGPFTTYTTFDFQERILYWAIICAVAVMLGIGIRVVIETCCGGESLRTDLLVTLFQAAVIGPTVWLINHKVYSLDVWSIASFVEHVGAVVVAGLLVTALRAQFRMRREASDSAETRSVRSAIGEHHSPEFMALIEETQRGPLKRISADDHYLHVVTPNGSSRILMRFRDALAQLHDMPGYRIHRSHWVAAPWLKRVRYEDRRYVAELTCGTELPVSRAYIDDLRRAGYLD